MRAEMVLLCVVAVYVSATCFWLIAEFKSMHRMLRLAAGSLAILLAAPVAALLGTALTQFKANRYFSHATQIIVDEAISSLKAGDDTLTERFEVLKGSFQGEVYENDQNLVGLALEFRQQGRTARHEIGGEGETPEIREENRANP